MTTAPGPTLVLWDIDHTLVSIPGVSHRIYADVFLRITGQPLREVADMAGRTERRIVLDTLDMHGLTGTEEICELFFTALSVAAETHRDEMAAHGRALPGAADTLRVLAEAGTLQSVVTGNVPAMARAKLEVFGLGTDLDLTIGGYGPDGYERAPLIHAAMDRAGRKHRRQFAPEQVVVVGDTPHDVAAALEVGVRAVGVATGRSSVELLEAAGADAVLPDLGDLASVRRAVLPRRGPT
ncbi:haloacid dehalogenase [Longispora fulva]|uniref:Phosphoglycolate phosphatase-like HAD superfamily hydrolase n=1 Tax=Longispora fulva TaxID=619741 RepID=A0A8J7GLP1_9ACTN|nr:HAD family hydrolase [Longispora fulva]MBG6140531.1 phosphoglycolate phosphatase-like HAD superfamily hydrolase [Longispora fulva]GIG57087.1 haloacid dehalogenase [Longispora fulva]